MSNQSETSFYSKVLLFGEYSVIMQSKALAIPYALFEGHLSFPREGERGRDPELKSLADYMKTLALRDELPFPFDVTSFEFDVSQGLYFDSTIPQGYGVGSSGALVAAVYDRYGCSRKKNTVSINELKIFLSKMESHFHGSSSGVDPLISYINQSLLIDKTLGPVELPRYNEGKGSLFLLNTGRSRKTEPLVNLFLEKCKNEDFRLACMEELSPITNGCITSFLEGQTKEMLKYFEKLSRFQLEHFNPMIPKLYRDIWKQGLEDKSYFLKLCGAGGGGFLMGITPSLLNASKDLSGHELRSLFRFDS